jgi:type IV pilus assembly protein PilW
MNPPFLRQPTRPYPQLGLSLIELLVASAIGLLLVATIGFAYLGAKASFRTQNAMGQIQENARYAFEFLGRDLRMAGFTGSDPSITSNIKAVSDPAAGTWDPNLLQLFGNGMGGYPSSGQAPLIGYESTAGAFPVPSHVAGDVVTVVHADDDNIFRVSAYVNPTFTIAFPGACPSSGLPEPGEIFVAADPTHVAVFQINTVSACGGNPGSMTVTADNNTLTPGSGSALGPFNNSAAMQLYRLSAETYYIDNNPAGEPSLYRFKLGRTNSTTAAPSAQELVEGVSDMQITYGVDTNGTGSTAVTNAVWSGGTNTITFTAAAHGLNVNDWVIVSGVDPAAYDKTYQVTAVIDANNFTVAETTDPGPFNAGGSVTPAVPDSNVDDYWTADEVSAGQKGGVTLAGAANAQARWSHVLSVRVKLTLKTKGSEKVSTSGHQIEKTYTTVFAIRNRLL